MAERTDCGAEGGIIEYTAVDQANAGIVLVLGFHHREVPGEEGIAAGPGERKIGKRGFKFGLTVLSFSLPSLVSP